MNQLTFVHFQGTSLHHIETARKLVPTNTFMMAVPASEVKKNVAESLFTVGMNLALTEPFNITFTNSPLMLTLRSSLIFIGAGTGIITLASLVYLFAKPLAHKWDQYLTKNVKHDDLD